MIRATVGLLLGVVVGYAWGRAETPEHLWGGETAEQVRAHYPGIEKR